MKAIRIEHHGLEGIELAEVQRPEPGNGEVLVRMRAASLNYRDLEVAMGAYHLAAELPLIPLSDGVGEVVELGAGAGELRVGDRVAPTFWAPFETPASLDFSSSLGGPRPGVLAEYVCLPAQRLVEVPAYLDDLEAATLGCSGVTAFHALVAEGKLTAGSTVVVQGTGGVATFALQFAAALGARVVVTSRSEEKLERARALGASATIALARTPDWANEVRSMTDRAGADHVIEVGGARSLAASLRAVRPGGSIHLIGYLGGNAGALDPMQVLISRAVLRGHCVGPRSSFEAMNAFMQTFDLHPAIDSVFPWFEVTRALAALETQRHVGKICLQF